MSALPSALPAFDLVQPRDIAGAIAARGGDGAARFIAGGTDLLPNLRRGVGEPRRLIDLSGIEELGGIVLSPSGARIGAGVTLAALASSREISTRYRALGQAAAAIAAPGHRTNATVGGNLCLDTRCVYYNQSQWWRNANQFCLKHKGEICHVAPQGARCHAAFSGDLAPALIALGAEAEIASAAGRRRIPLAEMYVEDGRAHLALADGDLLVAAHLPPDPPASAYEKVRVRGAIDFPLAGVAVAMRVAKRSVTELRVALTGTNSRPFLLAGADALIGRPLDEAGLNALDKLVQKQVQPMRTTIHSAQYRRLAAAALARRLASAVYAEVAR